jgi:hypothetical protein
MQKSSAATQTPPMRYFFCFINLVLAELSLRLNQRIDGAHRCFLQFV